MSLGVKHKLSHAIAALVAVSMAACSNIYQKQQLATHNTVSPAKKLAIFFDGTANNVESDTNVKRLHSLVSLQNKSNLTTLYVEGVGVGNDVLGAGLGMGFENRVVLAYNFLRNNYRSGDSIYIFGFSRGAFQARALTSMLQYIGLPDQSSNDPTIQFDKQVAEATALFNDMKEGFLHRRYPCNIATARGRDGYKSRQVKVLGLWDTVGALGGDICRWPQRLVHKTGITPLHVNIDEPNIRYGDQLRNVDNVLHAVSLDDNREWIFTPLLVSREHLLAMKRLPRRDEPLALLTDHCPPGTVSIDPTTGTLNDVPSLISEVWFPGAHSDVGGGYADSALAGLSLNWMITMLDRIEKHEANTERLLPSCTRVRQDVYGSSHNPEAGAFSILYHHKNRNLVAYAIGEPQACALAPNSARCGAPGIHTPLPAFAGKLCMHPSVIKRRQGMPPREHENQYLDLRRAGAFCVRAIDDLANPAILHGEHTPTNSTCPVGTARIEVTVWNEATGQCHTLED